jgi:hypothetical protein
MKISAVANMHHKSDANRKIMQLICDHNYPLFLEALVVVMDSKHPETITVYDIALMDGYIQVDGSLNKPDGYSLSISSHTTFAEVQAVMRKGKIKKAFE